MSPTANRHTTPLNQSQPGDSLLLVLFVEGRDATLHCKYPFHLSNFPRARNLLLILISLLGSDVVEAELVDALGGGDNAKPVTELLLLEVLLGPECKRAR